MFSIDLLVPADRCDCHAKLCRSTVLETDRLEGSTKIFAAGGGNARKAAGKLVCTPPLPPHVGPGSRIDNSCSVSCPRGNQLASIATVSGHGAVVPADGRAVKMTVTTPPCDAKVWEIKIANYMER